jgi:hypothetical protein
MFLGMVCSELGDELAFQGQIDAARNCYRTALDAFAEARTPGYAVFARRALARGHDLLLVLRLAIAEQAGATDTRETGRVQKWSISASLPCRFRRG